MSKIWKKLNLKLVSKRVCVDLLKPEDGLQSSRCLHCRVQFGPTALRMQRCLHTSSLIHESGVSQQDTVQPEKMPMLECLRYAEKAGYNVSNEHIDDSEHWYGQPCRPAYHFPGNVVFRTCNRAGQCEPNEHQPVWRDCFAFERYVADSYKSQEQIDKVTCPNGYYPQSRQVRNVGVPDPDYDQRKTVTLKAKHVSLTCCKTDDLHLLPPEF